MTDATFVTTGGAALKRFSHANNVSAFIPNPVDPSVEDLRNFERDDLAYDVFFAANASGDRRGRRSARDAESDGERPGSPARSMASTARQASTGRPISSGWRRRGWV